MFGIQGSLLTYQ